MVLVSVELDEDPTLHGAVLPTIRSSLAP